MLFRFNHESSIKFNFLRRNCLNKFLFQIKRILVKLQVILWHDFMVKLLLKDKISDKLFFEKLFINVSWFSLGDCYCFKLWLISLGRRHNASNFFYFSRFAIAVLYFDWYFSVIRSWVPQLIVKVKFRLWTIAPVELTVFNNCNVFLRLFISGVLRERLDWFIEDALMLRRCKISVID